MGRVHRACNDFYATEAARGRFLGSGLTRRQVIGRSAGAGLAVYGLNKMPLTRMLEAAEAQAAAAPNAPVLVSIYLSGGVDLLDTLTPLEQLGKYEELRANTKVGGGPSALPGESRFGVHPALTKGVNGGIVGLWNAGRIGFMPGIDYANPDLSHFHSQHFWETGLITFDQATGWLGRWLDRHGGADNPLQGLSSDYDLSPTMRSKRAPVAAVSAPGDAQFWFRDVWGESEDAANEAWVKLTGGAKPNDAMTAAKTTARLAYEVGERLAPYAERDGVDPLKGSVTYPEENDFGKRLKNLAAMISLPLGIRVATADYGGGFDTHDDQPKELAENLTAVSEALSAFQADLESRGVADRVLTFVWSEFGRRPEANESNGTDHGAGGLAFVMGTRAKGGILSDYPSLTALDRDDNLQVTLDFRRVYASLLEQWLGTGADEVIPNAGSFGRLQLVR